MITTQTLPYRGSKALADELNKESARHYNATLSNHWRTFRKKGVWLSEKSAYRWEDYQSGGTILHAHSRDAAQQAFYRSCKTARTLKRNGNSEARYPKYRRGFRTTIWKNTGIRRSGSALLLARARGLAPLTVSIPTDWESCRVLEARLVFDKKSYKYTWHMVLEDGLVPPAAPGDRVLAVDMGEIHPAVIADTEQALVLSCRALRACKQYGNKRRSELASLRDRKKRGSANRKRIQKRMNRFKAQQERREKDILHKVSPPWSIMQWPGVQAKSSLATCGTWPMAWPWATERTRKCLAGRMGGCASTSRTRPSMSGSRSCCRMSTTRPRHAPCVGRGKSPADASIGARLAVACSTGTSSAQSTSCLRTSTANRSYRSTFSNVSQAVSS